MRWHRPRRYFGWAKDNITMVVDLEGADDETVLDAARACPVDAIT
jgi:ferredoxin